MGNLNILQGLRGLQFEIAVADDEDFVIDSSVRVFVDPKHTIWPLTVLFLCVIDFDLQVLILLSDFTDSMISYIKLLLEPNACLHKWWHEWWNLTWL